MLLNEAIQDICVCGVHVVSVLLTRQLQLNRKQKTTLLRCMSVFFRIHLVLGWIDPEKWTLLQIVKRLYVYQDSSLVECLSNHHFWRSKVPRWVELCEATRFVCSVVLSTHSWRTFADVDEQVRSRMNYWYWESLGTSGMIWYSSSMFLTLALWKLYDPYPYTMLLYN